MRLLLTLILIALPIFMAQAQAKPTPQLEDQLMTSIENGEQERALSLIGQTRINLNYQGLQKLTPLMLATVLGQEKIVSELLKKKVHLELKNEVEDTALAMAVGNEQTAIAKMLIKAGAKIDTSCGSSDNSLLMCAVQTNNVELTKIILEKAPQQLQRKNKEKKTVTEVAEKSGTPAIKALLKKASAKKSKSKSP